MKESEQRLAAKRFVTEWTGRGDEKSDTQSFWLALLRDVYGVEHPESVIQFEKRVKLKNISFIDASIPVTHVLIEQKSANVDLLRPILQSDGSSLTPFQQAERYNNRLPYSQRNKWIIVCNFIEFHIHDLEAPGAPPVVVKLENLEAEAYALNFMTDETQTEAFRETQLSISAGELVGRLYDALQAQYLNPENPESLRCLNVLCVRLVFCFYAEDAGVLGKHNCVHTYLQKRRNSDLRRSLIELFEVLDTKPEERDPYLEPDLLEFPYVNGGLFHEKNIEIPRLTPGIADLLINDCSRDFDWSGISPTIFGAVFESTLNPETRRSGGMHYTSIENIHKVIDPLFLDDLRTELAEIFILSVDRTREKRLREFQTKLETLTFFDPACGSGNFLTETYVSIRRLENDVLRVLTKGQMYLNEELSPIHVSIGQFYGIEINDFAVSVARTALWIAECQMLQETEDVIGRTIEFLPLRSYSNITEGNALRLDWEKVVPKNRLNFIMGNPPFVGARMMNGEQKNELVAVFGKDWKNVGNLDYVCAWYRKAIELINGSDIRTAFVSTNSICQGEQVPNLWKPLFERFGIQIYFAWRTFRWDSEAKIKAHVHCVVVGFHTFPSSRVEAQSAGGSEAESTLPTPILFDEQGEKIPAKNINAYLVDAKNVFVESRSKPLCAIPEIGIGNKPIDGGNYLFSREEMSEFLKLEPEAEKYFKPWYGSQEFINQKPRWCLWLGTCPPHELRKMPHCMKRVEAVRKVRLSSPSTGTVKLADTPTRFHVENMPDSTFILVPKVSSERRRYIPIGFMTPDVLCSDLVFIIPDATLYHFGVLTSSVHMAWMRAVCGRLKSDYRYSKDVVYNNFPWPNSPLPEENIARTAQGILDARALYPDSSLADLYDELTMPPELRKAHQANDRAVMQAYGFSPKMTEPEIVAALMQRYQDLCVSQKP